MAYEHGRIVDGRDGAVLFAAATQPIGYFARLKGLLGRTGLGVDEAWWFARCSAIHTIGMRFALDIVHLDGAGRVVRVHHCVKPVRLAAARGSRHIVELAAGSAERTGIRTGQVLRFCP